MLMKSGSTLQLPSCVVLTTLIFVCINGFAQPTSQIANLVPVQGDSSVPRIQSRLPQCRGQNPTDWHMCFGSYVFGNGNAYRGEWMNGERGGVGRLRIVSSGPTTNSSIGTKIPSTYYGQFQGGRLNGHGVWIVDNGDRYEGEFSNNVLIQVTEQKKQSIEPDPDKFRKKCESYGLQFGTGDYAQCMLTQERMAAGADREQVSASASAKARDDAAQAELQKRYDEEQRKNAEIENRKSRCQFVKAQEYARPVLGGFLQSMQNANNAYENCMAGVPQVTTTCSRDGLGTITCNSR